MSVKKILVPEVGEVHFYKRRGTRSIRLSVGHDGSVRVSMPPWVPYRMGVEFAFKKRSWLQERKIGTTVLASGHIIGQEHRLLFVSDTHRTTIVTRITKDNEIRVLLPATVRTTDPGAQQAAERACKRALKNEAERLLPGKLYYLAQQYGFHYQSVTIKHLRSRWGSCSEKKNIALNSFLVQLPDQLIEYVMLHELVHTRIMAHGAPFWTELARYVPNLPAVRKEIRRYQPVLMPK